jgi:hypothetical protein
VRERPFIEDGTGLIRNDAEEGTMTTNAFGGQGGYPVPLVPVNLKEDQDVTRTPTSLAMLSRRR